MGPESYEFWRGSSGSLLVPRSSETTARPFSSAQTTAPISGPTYLFVPAEEQEWATLLASERKALAKKRIRPGAVGKAMREVRYGK
jgi:hypothetical protein